MLISHFQRKNGVKTIFFYLIYCFFRIDYTSKSMIYLIIKVNSITCKMKNIFFENPKALNSIWVNKKAYGLNNITKIKTV